MSYAYNALTPGEFAAAGALLPVMDIFFVSLRFWSKRKRAAKYEIEDWLVLPALACMIAIGGLILWGVATKSEGYFSDGKHDPRVVTAHVIYWNVEWLQCITLGCSKLSFLFLYYRIFGTQSASVFTAVLYVMMGICTIWMVGFFLGAMLTCPGNVSYYWTHANRSGVCFDTKPYLYALSWSDVVTDVIIILLPIPMLLRLHMTTQKKIAVIGIFMLGGLTLALSITRAVLYVGLLDNESGVAIELPIWEDPLMQSANGVYWNVLEAGFALTAVNLPVVYGSVQGESLKSVVAQVRSAISLRSWSSSQRSSQRARDGEQGKGERADSNATHSESDLEMQARTQVQAQ